PPPPPPPSGPAASPAVAAYSRAGAAQWAVEHAFDTETYPGADCTKFVSDAMSMGGRLAQQLSWWWYLAPPTPSHSLSWTVAKSFAPEMTNRGYVTSREINMSSRVIPGAALGDVILYDQNYTQGYNHVAIIVEITSNGTALIAQHSVARSYRIWNRTWEVEPDATKRAGWHAKLLHIRTDG
ncbi:amidase domain-containing protein, partial [Kribbella solani]|uniref:amidase domain-containing protein n=1 Tax=Kribbella solani TaxID=236067 RepID=UPI0038D35E22